MTRPWGVPVPGPIEAAPFGGPLDQAEARAMLTHATLGLPLGRLERSVLTRIRQANPGDVGVIASLVHRARQAGAVSLDRPAVIEGPAGSPGDPLPDGRRRKPAVTPGRLMVVIPLPAEAWAWTDSRRQIVAESAARHVDQLGRALDADAEAQTWPRGGAWWATGTQGGAS